MNNSNPGSENASRKLVVGRIETLGIQPNENLGQHFLVDPVSISLLIQSVSPGNTVIEIGAGVGQLTEALAQNTSRVISIEIDRRYEPILTQVTQQHSNIQVIFGDVIVLKLQDFIPKHKKDKDEDTGVQIVANLPFHITEPFLHKIAGLPIESATLVIGQRLMYAIQAPDEECVDFGQLTLLTQTFFNIDVIAIIEKQKFFPVPKTDSVMIRLTPKEEHEFRSNRREFLLRRLFLTAKRSPLVKNVLKDGLIEFTQVSKMRTLSKPEHNRRFRKSARAKLRKMVAEYGHSREIKPESQISDETREWLLTQNQARAIIEKKGIPDGILSKPFQQLNNNELKILSKALRL